MRGRILGAVCAVLVLGAVVTETAASAANPYQATIRRTAYGIPHIEAKDWPGLGFGYGYAFAQDNICVMADTYVTVDAERSRWFGPDESYEQRGNGVAPKNIDSDFFFQQIIDSKVIDGLLAKPPPNGLIPEAKAVVKGYVQGYNKYLKDIGGAAGVKDPACKGKPWVRPITEAQAYRRFYQLTELASGDVAIPGIAKAAPPTPSLPVPGIGLTNEATAKGLAEKLPIKGAGSNAVAIGRDGTRDKKTGLLLGNPHFPYQGPERFYQAHATIPGKFDVSGASLFGVPAVLIGHTKTMAWSHTVSTAFRFTPYQLTLVPGSPTTFLRDGKPVQMTSRDVTVQVPADGKPCQTATGCALEPQTRTLYTAPGIGPVFNELVGIPLPWTPAAAFALRDANAGNFRVFNHFFAMDRAKTTKGALGVLNKYQGIPWVNTIVADKKGDALYADIGAIPNVSNAKVANCNSALGLATFGLLGLPVLDGSRSACDWDNDPDAAEPGLFGPKNMPHLMRTDYVTNSNDSYWLANPKKPLEGFARIIGDERTPRSLRTRSGLAQVQGRIGGKDNLGPPGFTRQDMQNLVFSNRQLYGELVRPELVQMCRSFPGGMAPSSSGPVAVGNACDILASWDLHENLDSRGAILFRRFAERTLGGPLPVGGPAVSPWSTPFDPADAVETPRDLNTDSAAVQQALGDAINDLNSVGIKLDAAPRDVQFTTRGSEKIPIHGGIGDPNGQFNAITAPWKAGEGFKDIVHGSSYVQVVGWKANSPCPDARTILTYSQSSDSTSPHYADQTRLFSQKKWVKAPFCRKDVVRGTLSTTNLARGKKTKTTRSRRR